MARPALPALWLIILAVCGCSGYRVVEPGIFTELPSGSTTSAWKPRRLWLYSEGFVLVNGDRTIQGEWEAGGDRGCLLIPQPIPKGKDYMDVAWIGGLKDGTLTIRMAKGESRPFLRMKKE